MKPALGSARCREHWAPPRRKRTPRRGASGAPRRFTLGRTRRARLVGLVPDARRQMSFGAGQVGSRPRSPGPGPLTILGQRLARVVELATLTPLGDAADHVGRCRCSAGVSRPAARSRPRPGASESRSDSAVAESAPDLRPPGSRPVGQSTWSLGWLARVRAGGPPFRYGLGAVAAVFGARRHLLGAGAVTPPIASSRSACSRARRLTARRCSGRARRRRRRPPGTSRRPRRCRRS